MGPFFGVVYWYDNPLCLITDADPRPSPNWMANPSMDSGFLLLLLEFKVPDLLVSSPDVLVFGDDRFGSCALGCSLSELSATSILNWLEMRLSGRMTTRHSTRFFTLVQNSKQYTETVVLSGVHSYQFAAPLASLLAQISPVPTP